MNEQYQSQDFCYLHPKEGFVGICPLCLNEKLVAVASKQRRRSHGRKPKMFALGSLLNRLEVLNLNHHKRRQTFDFETESASTSFEESFISIKFEENGAASWEKKSELPKKAAASEEEEEEHLINFDAADNKSVVEHTAGRGSLRWRKRIGQLFQLVRGKRPGKANGSAGATSHVSGGIVKKARRNNNKSWIRALTRTKPSKA